MAADKPEPLQVSRNSIAFYEAVARGVSKARESMRLALCRQHPLDHRRPYSAELDQDEREAIEAAVEKLIAEDPDFAAIDKTMQSAIDELREAGRELERRGLR